MSYVIMLDVLFLGFSMVLVLVVAVYRSGAMQRMIQKESWTSLSNS
jgi:hypothetical protein